VALRMRLRFPLRSMVGVTAAAIAAGSVFSQTTTYVILDGNAYSDDQLKWAASHPVSMETPRLEKDGWYLVRRASDGQYYVPGTINGFPVTFLVDSGATNTAVGAGIAKNAGIRAGVSAQVQTANGYLEVARSAGNTLTIGPFSFPAAAIEVNLNPNALNIALLGMDHMRSLDLFQTKDGLKIRKAK